MNYSFLILALVIAVVDWVAVAKDWKRVEYFAKPGVMVALLAWLWTIGGLGGQLGWFAAGLLLSMAGDIFLMLPREQFIAGLVSFLLAHIAYLVGLNETLPPINLASVAIMLLIGLAGGNLFKRINQGLKSRGLEKLAPPVLLYSIVISLMLFSALITLVRPEDQAGGWMPGPAILVSAGALLFFLSDSFLAWNKFVEPLPYGRLRVIITYHLGQGLIALGAALHFLPLLS